MTIYYNAQDRKPLVKAIGDFTGADAVYMRTPTYAYRIDYFTVTRDGNLEFDDRADSEEIEGLIEFLDVYEGFPTFYYKTELELPVRYFSGKTVVRKAFVYIMHEERPLGLPSGSYVRTCLEGYSNFGFDESILLAALNNSRRAVHEIR